jgi:lipopolysaccharide export system protein LptC
VTPGKPTGDALAAAATKPAVRWIERQRASALDVQRYTRFVGIMKRALPMAAAALLMAVLAYSLQPRLQSGKKLITMWKETGILTNDLMMTKPKLTGTDAEGNPFVVTAERAIQDPHNAKRANLQKVEADVTLKKGNWVNLTSTRGLLDATLQKLWLAGAIDVYSDNGYEIHTTAATVDMLKGSVDGDKSVSGQGPFGTFTASRFRIERDTSENSQHVAGHAAKTEETKIYLYGNVHMTLLKHGAAHS